MRKCNLDSDNVIFAALSSFDMTNYYVCMDKNLLNIFLCLQWPAGDQRDETDTEDEESEDEEVVNERKYDFTDLYGINYWNYNSIDD